eukprot:6068904-Prymnesium_polylepis.1
MPILVGVCVSLWRQVQRDGARGAARDAVRRASAARAARRGRGRAREERTIGGAGGCSQLMNAGAATREVASATRRATRHLCRRGPVCRQEEVNIFAQRSSRSGFEAVCSESL